MSSRDDTAAAIRTLVNATLRDFDPIRSFDGTALLADTTTSRAYDAPAAVKRTAVRHLRSGLNTYTSHEIGAATDMVLSIAGDGPRMSVGTRFASPRTGTIAVDLGTASGEFALVDESGWTVVTPSREHGVLFQRPDDMAELDRPEPADRAATLTAFAELTGLDDQRLHLAWGWLAASVVGSAEGTSLAHLWITGTFGARKTSVTRFIVGIVDSFADPAGPLTGEADEKKWLIRSLAPIPTFDNVEALTPAQALWMKTLATGRRVDLPVLYSTAARYTVSVKRPAVLTSGKLPNLAPDLAERTVLLPLERRADSTRRTEADLNERYRRLRPRLLAVLLDDIAGILRNRRAALLAGRRLHRMADVSLALHALDTHLGLAESAGHFAAYDKALNDVMLDRTLDNELHRAVLLVAAESPAGWSGSAGELLQRIEMFAPITRQARELLGWPETARGMTAHIQQYELTYRAAGMTYVIGPRTKTSRS